MQVSSHFRLFKSRKPNIYRNKEYPFCSFGPNYSNYAIFVLFFSILNTNFCAPIYIEFMRRLKKLFKNHMMNHWTKNCIIKTIHFHLTRKKIIFCFVKTKKCQNVKCFLLGVKCNQCQDKINSFDFEHQ